MSDYSRGEPINPLKDAIDKIIDSINSPSVNKKIPLIGLAITLEKAGKHIAKLERELHDLKNNKINE